MCPFVTHGPQCICRVFFGALGTTEWSKNQFEASTTGPQKKVPKCVRCPLQSFLRCFQFGLHRVLGWFPGTSPLTTVRHSWSERETSLLVKPLLVTKYMKQCHEEDRVTRTSTSTKRWQALLTRYSLHKQHSLPFTSSQ